MAVVQKKDGRIYVRGRKGFWPDDPERTDEYFGRGVVAEAKARKRNAALIESKTGKKPGPLGPTFRQLATEYTKAKDFSAKSAKELNIRLKKIIFPVIGHRIAIRLAANDIDQFVAIRRAHKTKKKTYVKDSTIRREITDIKAILNWAVDRDPALVAFNPIAKYKAPDPDDAIILPPSEQEAARIYKEAAEHLKRVIVLSWYIGLRPGAVELLTLTWSAAVQCPLLPLPWEKAKAKRKKYKYIDVLLKKPANNIPQNIPFGIIRVHSAHKGGPALRDVPIHPGLLQHLKRWHAADKGKGHLIHYHGRPIKKIEKSWRGAVKRAKIGRRLRLYDLRHHFITRALETGADIGALSEIVGSRAETIRRHYQHVSRELTRKTVELIPELDTTADIKDGH